LDIGEGTVRDMEKEKGQREGCGCCCAFIRATKIPLMNSKCEIDY